MSVSTNIIWVNQAELRKIQEEQLNLKKGDQLEGRVINIRSDGKAEIEVPGKFKTEIPADSRMQAGDRLTFTVKQSQGKQLLLKIEGLETQETANRSGSSSNSENFTDTATDRTSKAAVSEEIRTIKEQIQQDRALSTEEKVRASLEKIRDVLQNADNSKALGRELDGILRDLKSYTSRSEITSNIRHELGELRNILALEKSISESGSGFSQEIRLSLEQVESLLTRIESATLSTEAVESLSSSLDDALVKLEKQLASVVSDNTGRSTPKAPPIEEILNRLKTDGQLLTAKLSPQTSDKMQMNLAELEKIQQLVRNQLDSLQTAYQLGEQITTVSLESANRTIAINQTSLDLMTSLSVTASDILSVDSIDKMPDIRESLVQLVRKIGSMIHMIDSESIRFSEPLKQDANELKQALEMLAKEIENSAKQLPDQRQMIEIVRSISNSIEKILSNPTETAQLNETVRSDLAKLLELVQTADERQVKDGLENIRSMLSEKVTADEALQSELKSLLAQIRAPKGAAIHSKSDQVLSQLSRILETDEALRAEMMKLIARHHTSEGANTREGLDQSLSILIDSSTSRDTIGTEIGEWLQQLKFPSGRRGDSGIEKILSLLTRTSDLDNALRSEMMKRSIQLSISDLETLNNSQAIQSERSAPPEADIVTLSEELRQVIRGIEESFKALSSELTEQLIETEKMSHFTQDIGSIRRDLAAQKENLDQLFRVIDRMDSLESAVQQSDLFSKQEIEQLLHPLQEARQSLEQIHSLSDLLELRAIIHEKIDPAIRFIENRVELPEQSPIKSQADPVKLENLKQILTEMKRELEALMAKIPEKSEQREEIARLLENIEKLTHRIAQDEKISENTVKLVESLQIGVDKLKNSPITHGNLVQIPDNFRNLIDRLNLQIQRDIALESIDRLVENLEVIRTGVASEPGSRPPVAVGNALESIIQDLTTHARSARETGPAETRYIQLEREIAPLLEKLYPLLQFENGTARSASNSIASPFPSPFPQMQIHQKSAQAIIQQLSMSLDYLSRQEAPAVKSNAPAVTGELQPEAIKTLANDSEAMKNRMDLARNLTQLMTNSSDQASFDKQFPRSPIDLFQMMSRLDSILKPVNLSGQIGKLANQLQSLIQDSGIFFEKKMEAVLQKINDASLDPPTIREYGASGQVKDLVRNDLKPNLMLLREYLNSGRFEGEMTDQRTLDTIRNTVEDLLNHVNRQQGSAQENLQNQPSVQSFSFAVPLNGETDPMTLTVFYNKKKKGNQEDGFMLSLLLSLDRIGEVRGDFVLVKKNLNITLYVKDRKIKAVLSRQVQELKEAIAGDFDHLNIQVLIHKNDLPKPGIEGQSAAVISDGKVDVKI